MKEIILTTPEQIKEIVKECLENHIPKQSHNLEINEPKLLYSIRELAAFLGCSLVTAQKLKNSKKIRYKQFGRKCVFNTNEILEDLDKGKK